MFVMMQHSVEHQALIDDCVLRVFVVIHMCVVMMCVFVMMQRSDVHVCVCDDAT